MTIGLEAFEIITTPKYNKSYYHEPDCILRYHRKVDEISDNA